MKYEGSAEELNTVLKEALEEAKEVIDELAKMLGSSGYPHLTEPVTLKDLQAMPQPAAVEYLREELKRTMMLDPVTGDKAPNPQTVEMVVAYLESQEMANG